MPKLLGRVFFWGAFVCFVLGLGAVFWVGQRYFPDYTLGQTLRPEILDYSVVITDRNGVEIHRSFDRENREWIDLEEIPVSMQVATFVAEDRRFYDHPGVDIWSIVRALWVNIRSGRVEQGASTLTQQIARKVFLSDEKTLDRKLREAAIALGMESVMTKNEILEMYLNTVPYGPTVTGVKSAANKYFGINPSELTYAQSLVLAALPQNPVRLARKKQVRDWLGTCVAWQEDETGRSFAVPEETEACTPDSVGYRPSRLDALVEIFAKEMKANKDVLLAEIAEIELGEGPPLAYDETQHFQFYVRHWLQNAGIDLSQYPGGLRIETSLDLELHTEVYDYMRTEAGADLYTQFGAENFAVMVLENQTRGPLVWVGSKAFWNEQIHGQVDMLRSRRQIGSAIKPLVYAGLFEAGFGPQTILGDLPVRFGTEEHVLRNADGQYKGWMSAGRALAQSRNVPAAQAVLLMGGESAVLDLLDSVFGLGVRSAYPGHFFGWTVGLGTSPVRLMDAGNAYAVLATGNKQDICPVQKITTLLGEEVPLPCGAREEVLEENEQFWVTHALQDASLRPAGWQRFTEVSPGRHVPSKTGTSNGRVGDELVPTDNVVTGYSPSVTSLLWAGNTGGAPLNPGSFALDSLGRHHRWLWQRLEKTWPDLDFFAPEGLVKQGLYFLPPGAPVAPRPTVPNMTILGGATGQPTDPQPESEPVSDSLEESTTLESFDLVAPQPVQVPTKFDLRETLRQRYQER